MDERTYESWWIGERYPQNKQIEKIKNELNKNVSCWLNNSPVGSPLLRHLFAIDSGCFKLSKDPNRYYKKRDERLKSIYEAINSVWEIFTSDGYKTTNNILDFTQQAPNAQVKIITENDSFNTNAHHLPRKIINIYRHNDPKSIFSFLNTYSVHSQLTDPAIKDIWILDMASLSLMLGPALYDSIGYDSQRKLGEIQEIYDMYRLIFFSNDDTTNGWFNFIEENFPNEGISNAYRHLRVRYHEMILEIGITPEDMQTIISYEPRNIFDCDITSSGLR